MYAGTPAEFDLHLPLDAALADLLAFAVASGRVEDRSRASPETRPARDLDLGASDWMRSELTCPAGLSMCCRGSYIPIISAELAGRTSSWTAFAAGSSSPACRWCPGASARRPVHVAGPIAEIRLLLLLRGEPGGCHGVRERGLVPSAPRSSAAPGPSEALSSTPMSPVSAPTRRPVRLLVGRPPPDRRTRLRLLMTCAASWARMKSAGLRPGLRSIRRQMNVIADRPAPARSRSPDRRIGTDPHQWRRRPESSVRRASRRHRGSRQITAGAAWRPRHFPRSLERQHPGRRPDGIRAPVATGAGTGPD